MRVRLTGLVGLSLAVLLGLTSMPNVFAQEKAQKAEKAKKADKAQKAPEKANIQGTVQNISKETSTLTVRVGSGTTATRMVVYSPSTKFLLGHSNDNKPGSATQVKVNNFISCVGSFDKQNQLMATECVYRETK